MPGRHTTTVDIRGRASDTRTYSLSTTAGSGTGRHITFSEQPGQMRLRTGSDLFDALFALAIDETRQCSVDRIADAAFHNGQPVPCECFETGAQWTYVWTRDTAYAVHLALALVDPRRAKNSLLFKLSGRKPSVGGGDMQIIQDTGSGGSYPISTDRVVWALGAREVLAFVDGAERDQFRAVAFEAARHTIEQDRRMVHDPRDGLYRGEQSFLDWREQSYPRYIREDTSHIAMSKALSTNVGHHALLVLAADLADELGDSATSVRYRTFADDLARAIARDLWLPDVGQFSAMKPTELDPAPVHKYDLLGASLAILAGIADAAQRARIVAGYPRTVIGSPVIWPQQPLVPIYHNRAIWPFVSAYSLLAAKAAGNAAVFDHDLDSLVAGAARHLSNMENFEFLTGASWVEDGAYSGPVVNSRRQLWSVAGYIAAVVKGVFGLQVGQDGVRFRPMVTRAAHRKHLGAVARVRLDSIPYRGRRLSVELRLPDLDDAPDAGGYYAIGTVSLDGAEIGDRLIAAADLRSDSVLSIDLLDRPSPAGDRKIVIDTGDSRAFVAPREPVLGDIQARAGRLHLHFHGNGERGVVFNVYRDGQRIAHGIEGTTFADPDSTEHTARTYHYAIEAEFPDSGLRSHRSLPMGYTGADGERVQEFDASHFQAVGGRLSTEYGRPHYRDWGDPDHTLELIDFRPRHTGDHYVQLVYGNGAGPVNTGITAAVKWLTVHDARSAAVIAAGPVIMPQRGDWRIWGDSTLVRVPLDASRSYRVTICDGVNMSYFDHFRSYNEHGGGDGPYNRVNITAIKFVSL